MFCLVILSLIRDDWHVSVPAVGSFAVTADRNTGVEARPPASDPHLCPGSCGDPEHGMEVNCAECL